MKMEELSLSDLIGMLSRHRKTVYRWIAGVTVAGILVAYLYPPSYQASSKVIVHTAGQTISLSDRPSDGDNIRVTIEDAINTELEIIKSRPVLERVLRRMDAEVEKRVEKKSFFETIKNKVAVGFRKLLVFAGLREEVSPFEARLADLYERITLNPILDSSVIEIIATAETPELAAAVANTITEEYMKYHLEVYKGVGASQFYNEQLMATRAKLEKLEDELAAYKEREGLVSIDDTKRNLLDQLSVLKTSLSDLDKEIISEESNLRIIKEQLRRNPEDLIPSLDIGEIQWIQEAMDKLIELELRLNELKQKYTTTHRELSNLEGEIKLTREFIKNEVQKVIDLKEVNLRSLKEEREALQKVIDEIQQQINELPKKELVIERLQRAIDETKEVYNSLALKMEESNIVESSDERVVNIRLISKAYPPNAPSFPNRILTILVSPLLGLVCGVVVAFIRELGSRRFTGRRDVEEELGIPVVTELPERKS